MFHHCKANSILDSRVINYNVELHGRVICIHHTVDKDSKELILLDRPDWFSAKFSKFDPWWLRADTATYDQELDKGIYTDIAVGTT